MRGARKGRIVSRSELADIFGVTPPTVDKWVSQGCPVAKEGGRGRAYEFNTAAVREWRDQLIRDDAKSTASASEAELLRRQLAAQTELAELKLAEAKRLVAPVDQMRKAISLANAAVRQQMRNIADRVPRMIVGETDEARIKRVIKAEIDQALTSLATSPVVTEADIELDDSDGED